MESNAFPEAERRGVYRAIVERRDVRCHFRADPIATDVLVRILQAAHHAPSVGFMQPWDFIILESLDVRRRVKTLFDQANVAASEVYSGERQDLYRTLKLEGILESPLNLCITCDRSRGGPHVLGRHTMIDTDQFSVCLAVQNLWLAARAEGVGVGWVSILDPVELAAVLKLPESVLPIAYLCLGYVSEFLPEPELQRLGWRTRLPLSQVVHRDCWGEPVEQSMVLDDSSPVSQRSTIG